MWRPPWVQSQLSGSRQARTPFDPESPRYREEAVWALRWGTEANRANREAIVRASPEVLLRAMNRLARKGMGIRRTSRGVEWLLWRGEGRCDTGAKFRGRNSWSIKPSVASKFAKDARIREREECPHVTAAWVPTSAVVSVPFMYGSEAKAWGEPHPGAFFYRAEVEIIVDPFAPTDRSDFRLRAPENTIGAEYYEPALPKDPKVQKAR